MTEYRAAPNPYIGWTDERLDVAHAFMAGLRYSLVTCQKMHAGRVVREMVAAHDDVVYATTEAVEACDAALRQIEEARSYTPAAIEEQAETRRAAAALRDSQV